MMSEYIVKHGQNIFDVALQLYGSIEGVFDLLISNPRLSMETQLEDGDVLCYHDYFVINSNIVASLDGDVVNGERSTYHQVSSLPLLMIIKPENDETTIDVSMSGEGSISIDWGDSSPMSNFTLHNEEQRISHYFNSTSSDRVVKIYGNATFINYEATVGGTMYPVKEIVADEYINHANKGTLKGLLLFKGTYKIDLSGSYIDSLLPIGDMSLQELDLQNCVFKDPSVLDEYLQYIVNNYGERRNCTIKLTQYPSTAGLMAINTILNEPSWNESGDWVFLINGIVFLGNVFPYPVPALL